MQNQLKLIVFVLIINIKLQAQVQTLLTDSVYQTGTEIIWWGTSFGAPLNPSMLQNIDSDTTSSANRITTEICGNSNTLFFDFMPNLPSGSVVQGFEVNIVKYGFNYYNYPANDIIARLIINGTSISNNQAVPSDLWPLFNSTPAIYTYGGSSDLWGLPTLPTNLTNVTFELKAYDADCQNIAIDYLDLKIYYTSTATGVLNQIDQKTTSKLYPNPSQNDFFVEFEQLDSNTSIEIMDALGQLVLIEKINQNRQKISTAHLPAGTYFVKTQSQIQKHGVQRLVVNK